MLDGVLAASAGDAAAVPAAFTAARLEDAHALQEVDRLASSFFRLGPSWGGGGGWGFCVGGAQLGGRRVGRWQLPARWTDQTTQNTNQPTNQATNQPANPL